MRASFVYHQITAIVSILITLYLLYLIYKKQIFGKELINPVLLLSISWGIHGIIHFLEEYIYDFEPISGNTTVLDKPIRI